MIAKYVKEICKRWTCLRESGPAGSRTPTGFELSKKCPSTVRKSLIFGMPDARKPHRRRSPLGPDCVKTIIGRSERKIQPFIEFLQSIESMTWKIALSRNWTNSPRHPDSPGFSHSLAPERTPVRSDGRNTAPFGRPHKGNPDCAMVVGD